MNTVISSLCSISLTWCITFPIDAVRVEQQITKNTTILNIIKSRYKNYGFLNFYNGLFPILIRSIPSTKLVC